MKVKTSITITGDLLEALDREAGSHRNRSEFIEAAVRAFILQRRRANQNAKDAQLINRRADVLNREAADVLGYQSPL